MSIGDHVFMWVISDILRARDTHVAGHASDLRMGGP